MTENSPQPPDRKKSPARRAPGWVAPALGGVVAVALTWGIGSTLFHGALVNRGLPEEIKGASNDERTLWMHGAELADLAARANNLAELNGGQSAQALANLGASLSQGAALLGELHFEAENEEEGAEDSSPDSVESLASDVTNFSATLPSLEDPSMERIELLSQIAFQINIDARDAVASKGEKDQTELAKPLSTVPDQEQNQPVACLPKLELLHSQSPIENANDLEPVTVARALDRGYALDFALQLQAARGSSDQEDTAEEQRTMLATQLQDLRSMIDEQCGDLRQPAYALPKDGLENLGDVVAQANDDFDKALVLATGFANGDTRDHLSTLAFEVLDEQSAANPDQRILESGTSVN